MHRWNRNYYLHIKKIATYNDLGDLPTGFSSILTLWV